jgi:hypothetical protein
MISCSNIATRQEGLTFHYYPQKNVYFDPATKKYFYSLDGAKTWDSLSTSAENPAALGPRMILTSTTGDIWRSNATHRKEYNGTLIDIPPGDTSLVTLVNRTAKKMTVAVKKKEKKQEKRNWWQRIFGKKKKTNDD